MTDDPHPPARHRPADGQPGPADSHAEQVLSQALRLMAGGGTAEQPREVRAFSAPRRLTTGQLLLLAAIGGLLVGITVGLLSLL